MPEGTYSIPALVDENAEELRREYMGWVYDLGNLKIRGKSIRSHLQLVPDFSFWWMTLIAEKEPLKSASIHAVFKMRALEKLCERLGTAAIVYSGADREIDETLAGWCRRSGRSYTWIRAGKPRDVPWRHRLLPQPVRAIAHLILKRLPRYWRAQLARFDGPPAHPHEVTIVTYFPNVDLERTRNGRFWSRYWERLHELLDELPVTVHWLWMYADSEQSSFPETVRLRDACNRKDPGKYRHFLVDEFMSPVRLLRAVRYYALLCWKSARLREARSGFHFSESEMNFYPVVRRDWRASLCGMVAIDAALQCAALEAAAELLPARPWGMFVFENQPWELALITAWRRNPRNGRIVGQQHSALRYLQLRSFTDPREYGENGADARPVADILAVNGTGAFDLMAESGFPRERLYVAEALRYPELARCPAERRQRDAGSKTLLLVTGYSPSDVRLHVGLVDGAVRSGGLAEFDRFVIKPHPFCAVEPVLAGAAPAFPYEIVKQPLSELWPEADAVLVANSTAAVLEAMYQRLPVAVCGPNDSMNLSPAFKRLPVRMICTAAQLVDFVRSGEVPEPPGNYFILDDRLERWRALLDPAAH